MNLCSRLLSTSSKWLCGLFFIGALFVLAQEIQADQWQWETLETVGQPTARHEAGLVAFQDKIYLIGGRRINPVDVFDPLTKTWTAKSSTPIELHHFQPVVVGDAIYLIGAMTGAFPNEKPLEKVVVYFPEADKFDFVHHIPPARRRGGAGAVVREGKIYIVGGITNGHIGGFQPWLDVYDPATGSWTPLPDATEPRDHFQAITIGNKLYAGAGRTTSQGTKDLFNLTIAPIDIYDFATNRWFAKTDLPMLPTPRAGNMVVAWGNEVIFGGGESMIDKLAHAELEAYNTKTGKWRDWPSLQRGRHGSGFAIVDGYLYTASGSGNRGGRPELQTIERLKLPTVEAAED